MYYYIHNTHIYTSEERQRVVGRVCVCVGAGVFRVRGIYTIIIIIITHQRAAAAGVLGARRRAARQSVTGRPCCDDETAAPAECITITRHPALARTAARLVRSPCGRRPPYACWCSSAFTCRSWPSEHSCSPPSRRRRKLLGSGSSRTSGKIFSTGTRVSEVYTSRSVSYIHIWGSPRRGGGELLDLGPLKLIFEFLKF